MSTNIKKNNIEVVTAGIDIGSNSIRMLIASIKNGKILKPIATFRDSTRLATGVKETGNLTDESISKSIALLKQYKETLDNYGITKIKVFATSAVREAKNNNVFLSLAKDIGLDIHIISGEDEARFVYFGVSNVIDFSDDAILFDIGGGSTEFINIHNKNILSVNSYKIGVVKLVDEFDIKSDKLININNSYKYIHDYIYNQVDLPKTTNMLVATAGTATTIVAIHQSLSNYSSELINNYTLQLDYILELYNRIITTPIDERYKIIGLEKGREDLIIPGTQILISVMKRLNVDKLKVADYGLREAAAIMADD